MPKYIILRELNMINIVPLKTFSLHREIKSTIYGFEFTIAIVEGGLNLTAAFSILKQQTQLY